MKLPDCIERFTMPLARRLMRPVARIAALETENAALADRVSRLEQRLFNYYRNRWDIIDCVADYLVNAELPGEYAEFGVFQGTTFGYAAKIFAPLFPQMRFLAFDSFEGLPYPKGIDKEGDFTSGFYESQFACDEERFLDNVLKTAPLTPERLITVKGWFDKTLTPQTAQSLGLKKLAAIWIDCDFYESTVPILNFISPFLSVGTVILFDDWRCYRNLPTFGEQRACAEWLEKNPKLVLNEFISFGFHGMSFTVGEQLT